MMAPEDTVAIRKKLGLSVDGLAAELGLTPAWDACQARERFVIEVARARRLASSPGELS